MELQRAVEANVPRRWCVAAGAGLAALICLLFLAGDSGSRGVIVGYVVDESGAPLADAIVRVRSTPMETTTDIWGAFVIARPSSAERVVITAWREGFYIGASDTLARWRGEARIVLRSIPAEDTPTYKWLPSISATAVENQKACDRCHARTTTTDGDEVALPVDEWLLDTHSQTATNERFLNMYLGQDATGSQSPPTRYGFDRDYGRYPLPPDPRQPYYGPGYKLDFPGTAGNCAACHVPVAAVNEPYSADPTQVSGVAAEGIACDFCHKVIDVKLDPVSGLPSVSRPGVLSYELRRPPDGSQLFTGPFDDVAPGDDTMAPVQRESAFCAGCHFGVFWDTTVYNSFGEWLASPFADPRTGRTCQDCHMPRAGTTRFATVAAGGLARDPSSIFSHLMPGGTDRSLLQNAVSLSAAASRNPGGAITVNVRVANNQTGHSVPTDSPLRQLLLVVSARDQSGAELALINGPVLPTSAGADAAPVADYAGRAGQAYARVLAELWTGVAPTAAYWNPTRVVSDNRLAASASSETSYVFAAGRGAAEVNVVLIYRRAFALLQAQKDWNLPDVVMESVSLTVAPLTTRGSP